MKKLFSLLIAVFVGITMAKGESIDLLDSTVTVNESTSFITAKTLYKYNERGVMINQASLRASWSKWPTGVPQILNRKTVFVYNDEGREIDMYNSSLDTATGIWKDTHQYIYDEWHNRTYSVGKWNADSSAVLSGTRYLYDDNHFLIGDEGFETWNGVEVITYKYFYENDAQGHKISMYGLFRPDSAYEGDYQSNPEKFNQSGWKYVDSAYYERNAAGQSLIETFFRWDETNNQWLKDGYQIFTYDENGRHLTDTVFGRDFETNKITYNNLTVDTYDSHGNCISSANYLPVFTENDVQWQFNHANINEYTYSENGLITTKRSHYDWNNGSQPSYTMNTYYYSHYDLDENGVIINSCIVASGTCGDNLTWEISCDSVLTISGEGKMYNWDDLPEIPWNPYRKYIKEIVLSPDMTSIGNNAFSYCAWLESITLTKKIQSIGNRAFYSCQKLSQITIPENIKSIGNYAFYKCLSLETLNLNEGVEKIDDYAFAYCFALRSIVLPNSVTSLGNSVFCNCSELSSITIPSNITAIPIGLCEGCGLSFIEIPDGVKSIGARAFYNCASLEEISLPSSLSYIDGVAFAYCTSLDTCICLASTPPTLGNDIFNGSNVSANVRSCLIVPSQSIGLYYMADQWREFNKIKAIIEPCLPYLYTTTDSLCSDSVFKWRTKLYKTEILNDTILQENSKLIKICGKDTTLYDTLKTYLGCDSVLEYNVHFFAQYRTLIEDTIYSGARHYRWGLVENSEIYKDTLISYFGCDSIQEWHITVLPKQQETGEEYVIHYKDNNNVELFNESIVLHVPIAPEIAGFTFVEWEIVSGKLADGIIVRAVYVADIPTNTPEIVVNPANKVQKLIRNGNVYILSDDKTYTITGQEIK